MWDNYDGDKNFRTLESLLLLIQIIYIDLQINKKMRHIMVVIYKKKINYDFVENTLTLLMHLTYKKTVLTCKYLVLIY